MAVANNSKTILSTVACYDAWSHTYDSDGNVLQLLDDVAFEEVAQRLFNCPRGRASANVCCELGCGTGRNTVKILDAGWSVVSINQSDRLYARLVLY